MDDTTATLPTALVPAGGGSFGTVQNGMLRALAGVSTAASTLAMNYVARSCSAALWKYVMRCVAVQSGWFQSRFVSSTRPSSVRPMSADTGWLGQQNHSAACNAEVPSNSTARDG